MTCRRTRHVFTLTLGTLLLAAQPSWAQPPAASSSTSLPPSRRAIHPRSIESMPSSRREAVLGQEYRIPGNMPATRRRVVPPGGASWQLGINSTDAPMGLLIENVQSWSAAYHAGLEPGDYVLDVNGYPVGFYQGGYFSLQVAFSMLADPNGWVELGIWNKRTKREEYMWVQLQPR